MYARFLLGGVQLTQTHPSQNIEHPSLASLLGSFSTPEYTVLAMDYCSGGELFDFIGDWHRLMPESLARRILGELAGAVGWMHSIGLVHRDIKLESKLNAGSAHFFRT